MSKIKKLKLISDKEKAELGAMLQQFVDPSNCDPDLGFEKYKSYYSEINNVAKELMKLGQMDAFSHVDFSTWIDPCLKVMRHWKHTITEENICEHFNEVQESEQLQSLLVWRKNLVPLKPAFDGEDDSCVRSLGNGATTLPFEKFNISSIWLVLSKEDRGKILSYLGVIFQSCTRASEAYMSPHFNSEKFSSMVSKVINMLVKVPELQGCGAAIEMLGSSVHMLDENYDKYYRTFIKTRNFGDIITKLSEDVEKQSKVRPGTKLAFKKLVGWVNANIRNIAGSDKDEHLRKYSEIMNEQLSELEKRDDEPEGEGEEIPSEEIVVTWRSTWVGPDDAVIESLPVATDLADVLNGILKHGGVRFEKSTFAKLQPFQASNAVTFGAVSHKRLIRILKIGEPVKFLYSGTTHSSVVDHDPLTVLVQ
jgi:hypothetical protein